MEMKLKEIIKDLKEKAGLELILIHQVSEDDLREIEELEEIGTGYDGICGWTDQVIDVIDKFNEKEKELFEDAEIFNLDGKLIILANDAELLRSLMHGYKGVVKNMVIIHIPAISKYMVLDSYELKRDRIDNVGKEELTTESLEKICDASVEMICINLK